MQLSEIDLNLLLIFDQLIKQRSVSAVAEAMDISQPAVSNALKRLRGLLEDELFIRGKRGMEPTVRAEQLAEPVSYALETLEQAVSRQDSFDPAVQKRNFDLAMIEAAAFFLPPLLSVLENEAVNVGLTVLESYGRGLKVAMEQGEIELAFGQLNELEGDFYQRRLFRDRFVLVMRKGHRLLAEKTIGKEVFSAAEHIRVRPVPGRVTELEKLLERQGAGQKYRMTMDNSMSVGPVLQSSDLVATIPERLAKLFCEPFGLAYRNHPIDLPERSVDMYWHARVHRDRGVIWLRERILKIFSKY